jgi:hypothetical protein
MAINSQHVTGFVIGLGAAAAGFYYYKKNQKRVDDWLRQQGIELPTATGGDYDGMALEELVREKEHLEDLIAEREYSAEQEGTGGENKKAGPRRKGAGRAGGGRRAHKRAGRA